MNWPNDADGDVFRRLQDQSFDFDKKRPIDFNVDFERWPPTDQALELLRAQYPKLIVYEPNAEDSGYVKFQVHDRPSYELVTRVQKEISALMAPFGGTCNSWGILH